MSKRNKLEKFSELTTLDNVYQCFNVMNPILQGKDLEEVSLKGQWGSKHFGNDKPIVLELACGRGEYTVNLARQYPNKNFIGVDIKGARIWKGATMARDEQLHNAAFLRTRIEQIALFFDADEIDEIWITFPDPFLRKGKANKRLTSPRFLQQYRQLLKKGGFVNLKTDEGVLYEYTLEVIAEDPKCVIDYQNNDIYAKELDFPVLAIKTYYERMHLGKGKTIKYVRYTIE